MRRFQPSPAMVVALLALVFAMAGTGLAARSYVVSSTKQIKNGAVTGADVKNSSLRGSDVKNSSLTGSDVKNSSLTGADIKNKSLSASDFDRSVQGPPGPQGASGPPGIKGDTGAAGPAGARGFSAWDTIPSGTTVTGTNRFDLQSPAASGDYMFTVALPAKAPQALTDANFAPDARAETIDDDTTCTGTVGAPAAPAGKVCLYAVGLGGANNVQGATTIYLEDHAFRVLWQPNAAGDTYVDFTWAYTAP